MKIFEESLKDYSSKKKDYIEKFLKPFIRYSYEDWIKKGIANKEKLSEKEWENYKKAHPQQIYEKYKAGIHSLEKKLEEICKEAETELKTFKEELKPYYSILPKIEHFINGSLKRTIYTLSQNLI